MALLWPWFAGLFALIPLVIVAYIWGLRRRRATVRYSSLSLIRVAQPRWSWLRRHLPFALFTLGLASLISALLRPVAIVAVPTNQTTIVVAIDVSRSMCARDVDPSRLEAAQAAVLSFIQQQKPGTQIGIVAFSGFAETIQAPTTDPEALQSAVESLLVGRRTAIGSGILQSIDAIAAVDPNIAPSVADSDPAMQPAPVPPGAYAPDIIVLLTDGVSNTGPAPIDAAKQAAMRGIRVYTIGFGTPNPAEFARCAPQLLGGEITGGLNGQGGFGSGFGGGFRRGVDEATLIQVAEMTGGAYYPASSAGELQQVFARLPTYLITKHEVTEVSVFFVAVAAVLVAIALALGALWRPLP